MKNTEARAYQDYEDILNEELRDVVLEIRSVALVDLTSFIHANKFENIADIFNSATELYFKPGTLQFSYTGNVELGWFGAPIVALDIEFHGIGVDIFFKLEIDALSSRTEFLHVRIGDRPLDLNEDMEFFLRAIRDVKVFQKTLERGEVFRG